MMQVILRRRFAFLFKDLETVLLDHGGIPLRMDRRFAKRRSRPEPVLFERRRAERRRECEPLAEVGARENREK